MWADTLATAPVAIPEPTPLALRYYHGNNILWIVDTVISFLVPGVILFAGWSARLRAWAARRTGGRRTLTLMLYVVAFIVLTSLATLPLDFYEGFIREHAYGLSDQTLGKWAADAVKGLLIVCIVLPIGALIPYALLRWSPQRWWLWSAAVALPLLTLVYFVFPIWVSPLFNRYGPLQDKVLEGRILAEAERAGVQGSRVFEVNKSVDTKAISAYVTGFGASKRIVLYDTILQKLDSDEIVFVVGHEIGHFVLKHVVLGLIGSWLVIAASLYAIHRLAGRIIATYRDRVGFDRLDDPASIPLFLVLANVVSLLASPILLAGSRYLEHEADRFGLELTQNSHAAATAFVKLQQENLGIPRPGAFYTIFRGSHPSLADRIEFANDYHPWTTGAPLVYGDHFARP